MEVKQVLRYGPLKCPCPDHIVPKISSIYTKWWDTVNGIAGRSKTYKLVTVGNSTGT